MQYKMKKLFDLVKNWVEKTRKRFYEDKPFKEGDKELFSSRIEEAEGRENLYQLSPKWKNPKAPKMKDMNT